MIDRTLPAHLAGFEATGVQENEPIAQFELGRYRNFVYLVIAWRERNAWIVDPQSELGPILEALKRHKLQLNGILLTHTHPDHVAGVPELLRMNPGLRIIGGALDFHRLSPEIHAQAKLEAIPEGAKISVGASALIALHTPGHSAGEVCYFLESPNPHSPPYLLTGDTVFIRDCGRTDFPDGSNEQLFQSLQRIRALPPETVILPGHHYQRECASTLGREILESPPFRCKTVMELASLP